MNKIIWTTNIGSHAWHMNHADSDIDVFDAYIVPTKDILSGKNNGGGSHFHEKDENDNIDKHTHEIGKIIDELIKGNINFLIGTLSPIVLFEEKNYLKDIRQLVINHCQTKSCTHSIKGLAISNYKKYIIGSDTARDYPLTKKCNMIVRTLMFGINILRGNGFKLNAINNQTPEYVKQMLIIFDEAFINSKIPDKTDPEPFRNYLYELRLKELNNEI